MIPDNCDLNPNVVPALLDEMLFWNRQLDEHARLIRSGVDLGQDDVIQEADQYVALYDRVLSKLQSPGVNANPTIVNRLLCQTKTLAAGLRESKIEVGCGIAECRIKAIIPAEILNHTRQELDYLIGKLNAVIGGPVPTWADLGLDHSQQPVSLVPRMLLEEIEDLSVCQVSLEEMLFLTHNSAEHAKLLAEHFRPIEQIQFTQEASQFSVEFDQLHQQTFQSRGQRRNLADTMQSASELNQNWLNYLLDLNRLLATCQIQGRQTNFWPALGVHIYREQGYFQSILIALIPRAQAENC